MKRKLAGILTLVVLSLFVTAIGASAQTAAKANVPFNFQVGNAHMAAGSYLVSEQGMNNILIRGLKTTASAMSTARPDEASNGRARLVFYHYGDHYILTQVWGAYGTSGLILPTSKLEKELRASSVDGGSDEGEVIIALN
jgi:hypothetical protein